MLPPLLLQILNIAGYVFMIAFNSIGSAGGKRVPYRVLVRTVARRRFPSFPDSTKNTLDNKKIRHLRIVSFVLYPPRAGFGGKTNGDISSAHPTKFTPAGWAFSIWGLIFAWMGIFTIYQALPFHRRMGDDNIVSRIGLLFVLNTVANGLWAIPFAFEVFWLSVIVIVFILVTLILIYNRLEIGLYALPWYALRAPTTPTAMSIDGHGEILDDPAIILSAGNNAAPPTPSRRPYLTKFWLCDVGFSLYLGWISVATIANISIFLSASPVDFNPPSASGLAVMMICIAAGLACIMIATRADAVYAAVVSWATFAIAAKQVMDGWLGWLGIFAEVRLLLRKLHCFLSTTDFMRCRLQPFKKITLANN